MILVTDQIQSNQIGIATNQKLFNNALHIFCMRDVNIDADVDVDVLSLMNTSKCIRATKKQLKSI